MASSWWGNLRPWGSESRGDAKTETIAGIHGPYFSEMLTHLRTDLALRARYSQGGGIYRILPAAVARPTTLAELRDALAEARAARLAIIPRGAGSAMGGSNVGEGVVFDLTGFEPGLCTLDLGARTARCSPAVSLRQLHALTTRHGLHLPLDPSSAAWATLGGLVATNAAGARTVQHGAMREWVAGVVLETDDGPLTLTRGVAPDASHPVVQRWTRAAEPLLRSHRDAILARWPATRKNTLGYDLATWFRRGELLDLVIGSEGTLGILTEITVRLAPIAPVRMAMRVVLERRSAVVPALETIRRYDPAVLEFLDASFLRVVEAPVDPAASAVLLADLEGDDEALVRARALRCAEELRAIPDVIEVVASADPERVAELWQIRHGASSRLAALTDGRESLQVIEDGCVPPAALADYLDAVEAACRAVAIDAVIFGHAGDGHVHVNLLPDVTAPDWLPRVRSVYAAVAEALHALGGTPAGEHGTGRLRAPLVARFLGPEAVAVFEAIQAAFDPAGRWNPGIIVTQQPDPFLRLKVGAESDQIPDGVAALLRRIEREARWGESRWEDEG